MLRTWTPKAFIALLVIGLIGLVPLLGSLQPKANAVADDLTHTTSWIPVYETWDPAVGAEYLVKATFTTTDTFDVEWRIETFLTPPGGSETQCGGCEGSAADGNTTLTAAIVRTGMTSGTVLRAQFRSWDALGTMIFNFSRSFTVP